MRASDAEREQFVGRLHQAATEGRIGADELEHRVTAALRARTYAELDATVADLPSPRQPRGTRHPERRSAAGWAMTAVRHNPWLLLFAIPVVTTAVTMLMAATIVWAVLMVVVMILGGRPCARRSPWAYARHGRIYGPPRRRPRSYWA